ncbi:MAG: cell division protein ZapB [candidate division Zixibacteria bacterium]|nr:cell division protein ZapB [candidate division Zixibacteria bacterium]
METFEKLEEKINQALSIIEKLTVDNKNLRSANDHLKKELEEVTSKLAGLEKLEVERADKMKSKLNNILNKLGALEQV